MAARQSIQLGRVQESLLVPLYARALDSLKKRPSLNDAKAVEMVQSIDCDFPRINQGRRMVGCILRTAMLGEWVKETDRRGPGRFAGTVVGLAASCRAAGRRWRSPGRRRPGL